MKEAGLAGLIPFVNILLGSHTEYFNYARIAEVVATELTRAQVDEVDGELIGHFSWMTSDYATEKEAGTPPEKLLDLLRTESRKMHALTGRLRQGRFAQTGLPVFLLAATGHLTLIQEMQLLRAAHPALAAEPTNAEDLREVYHDHAVATWAAIAKKRGEKCRIGSDDYIASERPLVVVRGYRFHDELTGYWSKTWRDHTDDHSTKHSGHPPCAAAHKAYMDNVYAELHKAIGQPHYRAEDWLKLAWDTE